MIPAGTSTAAHSMTQTLTHPQDTSGLHHTLPCRDSSGLSCPQKQASGTRSPKIIQSSQRRVWPHHRLTDSPASPPHRQTPNPLERRCVLTPIHTHTDKQQPKIHTSLFSKLSLVKLQSHQVYQPKESRDKIKTQEKNAYEKILKLTPESSRYLCGVEERQRGGVREEKASLRRAGPRLDPRGTGLSAEGNRVARPGPCPPRGYRLAPGSPHSLPYHLSKDLTTKEEPGRKSGGGEIQSLPSPSEEGVVSSYCPLPVSASFWRQPPNSLRTLPSADNTHSGTDVHRHLCTQLQVHRGTHSASPLPSKPPE